MIYFALYTVSAWSDSACLIWVLTFQYSIANPLIELTKCS